jgi:Mg2+ and Co2+ transporter CorA
MATGECRDIGELERLMTLKFEHLEALIKDFMQNNNAEHKHFQEDIRELYNENKKMREESAAADARTLVEVDKKFETISNRLGNVEQSITEIKTESKVREKSFTSTITIVGAIIAVLTFAINYLMR